MAIFFPQLSTAVGRMQSGERRLARRLEALLEDDYLCWYEVGIGGRNVYPDFILLHPARGVLILEVKDWKIDTIRGGDKHSFQLLTSSGLKRVPNPLEQARQYAHAVVNLLVRDPQLRQAEPYKGRPILPWGYGVVFSNLSRQQARDMQLDQVLQEHLMLCKDDLAPSLDAESFQQKLWGMFNYQFTQKLTQPQIDRVRAHLWPEICVQASVRDLLAGPSGPDKQAQSVQPALDIGDVLPDVISVMDFEQEQLARSLGEGHRVIHGVAGSGKTMILGFRCLHLAKLLHKPVLILCFNVTLAARLRSYVQGHCIEDRVQVYNFHAWCKVLLNSYQVVVADGEAPIWERQVEAVIRGVERGQIPRAQYGAVLIDEAHDFQPEWLRLVTGMVDPETNSLLLLYDDTQTIYPRGRLGFTLSSVGVQARGRTKVLKVNYRNTRQILQFAFNFVQSYVQEHDADDDSIPLIKPEAGGKDGALPELREFHSKEDESAFIVKCLQRWHQGGRAWNDVALVYRHLATGKRLARVLDDAGIPYLLTHDRAGKASFDSSLDRVSLQTMHSSKGLEFPTVIVAGVGEGAMKEAGLEVEARLLYVAMTRAMENLLVTTCARNVLSRQLVAARQALGA
jgi:hypothetical protein